MQQQNVENALERSTPFGTIALVVAVFSAVLVIWARAGWFVAAFHPGIKEPFVPLDTLFDGLAFFGISVAIILQTQELALQRKELRRSTEAQRQAGEALTKRLELEETLASQRATLDQEIAAKRAELDREMAEQRAATEREIATIRLTMTLFDEWYSPELQEARIKVQPYLRGDFMRDVSLTNLTLNNTSEVEWFLRVLAYFRKWSLLAAEGQIDNDMLHRLIGYEARWWHDNFVTRFASTREQRADYKELLESVSKGALSRYRAG